MFFLCVLVHGFFFFCRLIVPLRRRRGGCLALFVFHAALPQQSSKVLLRHRLSEQKALTVVATHGHQRQGVAGAFNPDRDRDLPEIVREIDHGLAQGRVDVVGPAIRDKAAVELDLSEREVGQLGER